MTSADEIPEIDLTDMELIRDPFGTYGAVREKSPIARMQIPGIGPVWVVTRHEGARAMLGDPRFEINADSFMRPAGIPEHCLAYLRTMSEMNGPEHSRLRRLASPAFTARRAAEFRPRIEPIVNGLLDGLPREVDLLEHFARPLPIDVICELVGIPEEARPRWREYGASIAAGHGQGFADAVPAIVEGAEAAIAQSRTEPGDDLVADLIRLQAEDGDRMDDIEMVTMVWHLVLAGQTPTNLIANAVDALLSHPKQLATLRADNTLMPRAVEELTRWCGPTLLTIPRYATEDVDFEGQQIKRGDAISASVASANRDPRVFDDPERLDITRTPKAHLGFGHGPHFCLGASLARVQVEVALTALLTRDLAATSTPERALDPGTWRLTALPVTL